MQPVLAAGFADPLDVASPPSVLVATNPVNGLARAGSRIVAVGQHGQVAVSPDQGKTWKQAVVPVSSDLVAVYFPSPACGWAVGHDGVVIVTADGGDTWTRQFDGRAAGKLMAEYYATADPQLAEEGRRYAEQGPDKPFLDVWFENEKSGYAVGAFNLIFRTDDGGKTWTPYFDRTENPRRLHLHAVRAVGEDVFIAGEQGLVMKLDRQSGRFRALATPYNGTYFGITGKRGALIVYGLRGTVYRSTDGGASWTKVETGLGQSITAAALGDNGEILLASQDGKVLASADDGASFHPLMVEQPGPTFAILAQGNKVVLRGGLRGVQVSATHDTN